MIDPGHFPDLTWASERHLRVSFGTGESVATQARVRQAVAALEKARPPGLLDITPAYSTILLEFALGEFDDRKVLDAVRDAVAHSGDLHVPTARPIIEIPVCYEPPCAPDAEVVARILGIDVSALVRLHTQPLYTVGFIGFAPGFAYLSGLPSELAIPRLATPRVRVPVGSVGIAEQQTGVYPTATAGGWRLIGRTPLVMFDAKRDSPSLLSTGDRVRFKAIRKADFDAQMRGDRDHE